MRAIILSLLVFTVAACGLTAQANAQRQSAHTSETNFVVTVRAKDSKFIGSAAGGARIIIRDKRTGDIIANGVTAGGTGDTKRIMEEGYARDAVLIDEDTARFEFSLDFWEPTPVTITATAPLGQLQSLVTVSEDMLILPGKDYASGNGIMLEVPGFAIDITAPLPNQKFEFNPKIPFTLEANIMKLCGCKIAEDSPWDPERYDVEALIYRDSLFITAVKLPYTDEPGVYGVNINIPLPGSYRIIVTAFDPVTKEAGMDITTIILEDNKKDNNAAETKDKKKK